MSKQCFMNTSGKLSEEYFTSRNLIFAPPKYCCRKLTPSQLHICSYQLSSGSACILL